MLEYLDARPAPVVPRDGDDVPSPTVLVAKVLAGALLVFAGLTFVALAPTTMGILVALAGISGALAWIGRERDTGPRTPNGKRRGWSRGGVGWGSLAVSSVALLVLALLVPEGYDVLFAALGLTGMVVIRLGTKPTEPPDYGHAHFSASDRLIPRGWRRRPSLEQWT
jgi:hypothetical protein